MYIITRTQGKQPVSKSNLFHIFTYTLQDLIHVMMRNIARLDTCHDVKHYQI